MDFSKVKIWKIPDEFGVICNVTKVVDRNGEGDVIWQLFESECEIIDLTGHPDFCATPNTGWTCHWSPDNKIFDNEQKLIVFGPNSPLYFKIGIDNLDEGTFEDIDPRNYCKLSVLIDDVDGNAKSLVDKYYTNYAAAGLVGTYTLEDLIRSLRQCSSLAETYFINGGDITKVNLYYYKSGINPPIGNKKVYIILYNDFSVDTSISWDLEDLAISASAYTKDFNIYDPTQYGWALNCSESWLDVDEITDSGDAVITLICGENPTIYTRTATLELLDSNGNLIDSKCITQAGKNVTYSLNIDPKVQEVSGNGDTTTITITSSHTVTYSTTDSWLKLKMNNTGTQLTVTADSNLTGISRTGKINFICGDKKSTASIVQGPGSDLTVQDSVTVLPGTTTNAAVIPVTSSFGWTFTANLTGAIAEKTSTNDAIQIQVTSPNTSSTRKTLGTITVTDNVNTKTVTVYQDYEKIEVLTYAHNDPNATFSVGETISTLGDVTWTIAVSSNTNWTLTLSGTTTWSANGAWTYSSGTYKYFGKGNDVVTITSPNEDIVPAVTLTITYGLTNKSGGKITYTT